MLQILDENFNSLEHLDFNDIEDGYFIYTYTDEDTSKILTSVMNMPCIINHAPSDTTIWIQMTTAPADYNLVSQFIYCTFNIDNTIDVNYGDPADITPSRDATVTSEIIQPYEVEINIFYK